MRTTKHFLVLSAAILMAGGVAACDDNLGLNAFEVPDPTEVTVYALNGTSLSLPAGLALKSRSPTLVDLSGAIFTSPDFDLIFDLNDANEVVVYTPRSIVSELVNLPRVGLQTTDAAFASVIDAPGSGYTYDSLLTLPINKTLIVDKVDPTCNAFGGAFLGFNIRAKLMVTAVNTAQRSIKLTVLSNPNCGYRSLEPGEPED